MNNPNQQPPAHHTRWIPQLKSFLEWAGLFAHLIAYGTVIVGVIFYITEGDDRQKEAHYQAWQLINSAQAQRSSGGRIDALQDLNRDGVTLARLAAPGANLRDIILPNADLHGVDFSGADLRYANLTRATLFEANLQATDLGFANLTGAHLDTANLTGANLGSANLTRAIFGSHASDIDNPANLTGARLEIADLTGADLRYANLTRANLTRANLTGTSFLDANLTTADFQHAKGLSVDQIKKAKNWELAIYDDAFRAQLGLPPAPSQTPQP